jgi:hypothetical protein
MRRLILRNQYLLQFIVLASIFILMSGCSRESYEEQFTLNPRFTHDAKQPVSWREVTDKHRCYLKVQREWRPAFRVNCFQIDGELYTHSNRFVEYNQILTTSLGLGEAWVYVVAKKPDLLVAIDGQVHEMRASLVSDLERRNKILSNRGYDPVPEAIRVYRLGKVESEIGSE